MLTEKLKLTEGKELSYSQVQAIKKKNPQSSKQNKTKPKKKPKHVTSCAKYVLTPLVDVVLASCLSCRSSFNRKFITYRKTGAFAFGL